MIYHRYYVVLLRVLRLGMIVAAEVNPFQPCDLLPYIGHPVALFHLLEYRRRLFLEVHVHEVPRLIHFLTHLLLLNVGRLRISVRIALQVIIHYNLVGQVFLQM